MSELSFNSLRHVFRKRESLIEISVINGLEREYLGKN